MLENGWLASRIEAVCPVRGVVLLQEWIKHFNASDDKMQIGGSIIKVPTEQQARGFISRCEHFIATSTG
jgi:hypothetical protein